MRQGKVVSLKKPVTNSDTLTELLRDGARALLFEAVQAELTEFLCQYQGERRGVSLSWGHFFVPKLPETTAQ